jgi:hypothetical protein
MEVIGGIKVSVELTKVLIEFDNNVVYLDEVEVNRLIHFLTEAKGEIRGNTLKLLLDKQSELQEQLDLVNKELAKYDITRNN